MTPCEICGEPTSTPCGVCRRRDSPECIREYQRRYAAAPAGFFGKRHVPCAVCGRDTTSEYGVCNRAPECRSERYRRGNPEISRASAPCDVCGARTRSALGVCQGTPECKREQERRRRLPGQRELRPCDVCGAPCRGRFGVCTLNPDCKREYHRRFIAGLPPGRSREYGRRFYQAHREEALQRSRERRAANLDEMRAKSRERTRRWRAEHPEEHARYKKADAKRRESNLRREIITRDGGVCSWCHDPFPADLSGTHFDHIIPRASGVVIEDDWNIQLLHAICNIVKRDRITPQALSLAAEHGITIPARYWRDSLP